MDVLIFAALVAIVWLIPTAPSWREVARQEKLQREAERTNQLLKELLVEMRRDRPKQAAKGQADGSYGEAVVQMKDALESMQRDFAGRVLRA